jgi:hypothetical protein
MEPDTRYRLQLALIEKIRDLHYDELDKIREYIGEILALQEETW